MVILLRCNDLSPDPRVDKYIKYFEKNNIKYLLVGWNRSGSKITKKNTIFFNKKAQYGARAGNLFKKVEWNFFVIMELIKNRKNYNVIHACDFDTAFPALIMKFFRKKIVFDVFDWIGDSRLSGINIIDNIIKVLERFTAKNSDALIICEEGRKKQLKFEHNNLLILPNIPNIKDTSYKSVLNNYSFVQDTYNVTYVGVFDKARNLETVLLLAAQNSKVHFHIAGFGYLEPIIRDYAQKYENIHFYGKINYSEALKLMAKADLIYAMYCKSVENHIYAAPNKYYESLLLSKPLITTKGTLVGDNTDKGKTGFVIEEDFDSLNRIFQDPELNEKIVIYSENARELWEKKYKDYVTNFMENKYSNLFS